MSKAWPIADGALGAIVYTLELVMTWMAGKDRWRTMPWMVLALAILILPLGYRQHLFRHHSADRDRHLVHAVPDRRVGDGGDDSLFTERVRRDGPVPGLVAQVALETACLACATKPGTGPWRRTR